MKDKIIEFEYRLPESEKDLREIGCLKDTESYSMVCPIKIPLKQIITKILPELEDIVGEDRHKSKPIKDREVIWEDWLEQGKDVGYNEAKTEIRQRLKAKYTKLC